ncbi:MAG: DNA-processing protein DprA [Smithellaceae bacterium]|nr:DNA-processing protein DprA [Smithellaceae bacterium]
MKYHNLIYWFALKSVQGLGNVGYRLLVDAFGSPAAVFNASLPRLRAIAGIGEVTARQILQFRGWDLAENEFTLLEKNRSVIVTYKDPQYPRNLLNIYDFPPFLYVKGTLLQEDIPVAVVGSRLASAYGRFSTERLSRELALSGITVVSGLARGIDSAAHRGAISGHGRTIAVLGCGLDIIYPSENVRLYETIPDHGALVTEYPFGTSPHKHNFPARNRLISGISYGVAVVEAGEKSGSLITARFALEQGREVFAVPGAIDSAGSRGTHKMIRDGARLIESAREIIEEISPQIVRLKKTPPQPAAKAVQNENDIPLGTDSGVGHSDSGHDGACPSKANVINPQSDQATVMRILSHAPLDIDGMVAETGLHIADIQRILLSLELQGSITKLPGNNYKIKD